MEKIDSVRDCGHYPVQLSAHVPRTATDVILVLIEGGFRSSHATAIGRIWRLIVAQQIYAGNYLAQSFVDTCGPGGSAHSGGAGAMKPFAIMLFVKSLDLLIIIEERS